MAKVVMDITSGVLCDHLSRTMRPVTFMAFPPEGPPPGMPPGIWGGPIDPYPGHPLPEPEPKPPGIWGGPIDPYPGHPLPPIVPVPPNTPDVPPPGSPPVIVGGTHPVQPMVPPDAVAIEYPGIGKVIVPKPLPSGEVPAS